MTDRRYMLSASELAARDAALVRMRDQQWLAALPGRDQAVAKAVAQATVEAVVPPLAEAVMKAQAASLPARDQAVADAVTEAVVRVRDASLPYRDQAVSRATLAALRRAGRLQDRRPDPEEHAQAHIVGTVTEDIVLVELPTTTLSKETRS